MQKIWCVDEKAQSGLRIAYNNQNFKVIAVVTATKSTVNKKVTLITVAKRGQNALNSFLSS